MTENYPFFFADSWNKIQKQLPGITQSSRTRSQLTYQGCCIVEHPFDCGCILLNNIQILTKEYYEKLEHFLSLNGYSKIIANLSLNPCFDPYTDHLEFVKSLGFLRLNTGLSNRNPEYYTFILVKVINPIHKGY